MGQEGIGVSFQIPPLSLFRRVPRRIVPLVPLMYPRDRIGKKIWDPASPWIRLSVYLHASLVSCLYVSLRAVIHRAITAFYCRQTDRQTDGRTDEQTASLNICIDVDVRLIVGYLWS